MGYGCQKEFHLNDFHRANYERQREAFAPPHNLTALVVCVQEEVGELAAAVLGVTGEKKRKAHLTKADVLDAEPPVRIFVMGENRWRDEAEFPLARTRYTSYYLHSAKSPNTAAGDGALSVEAATPMAAWGASGLLPWFLRNLSKWVWASWYWP
jgi:hypothetical protein